MAPIHHEFRLFAAPTPSVSRAVRCIDQSPRDRVSVADAPHARHVPLPRARARHKDAHALIVNSPVAFA